ncbi:MAG: ABC transporter permease [Clostridium sp.]
MLYKNVFKLFKKKKIQLFGVGIIIFLSSFLYTSMYNAMNSLETTIGNYFEKSNQEKFAIDTLSTLSKEEYLKLSEEGIKINPMLTLSDIKAYDLSLFERIIKEREEAFLKEYPEYVLETREAKDITFTYNNKPIKFRALKDNSTINLSYMEEGIKPEKNDEIAVTRAFADDHKLSLNNKIDINGKEYTITGFVLFPDYTLPMLGSEFIIDVGTVTLGLFSDEEFESLQGKEVFCIGGVAKDEFDIERFNAEVKDTYSDKKDLSFITNITETKANMKSGLIQTEVLSGKAASIGLSIMVASIAILIVAIIVYKILSSEKAQIGVLKAMGYLRKEIAIPYISVITIVILPMLIIGCIAGMFVAEPLKNMYLMFYLLPKEPITLTYSVIFIALIVPLVFFGGLSYLIIMKMLNKNPLDLLRSGENDKVSKLTVYVDKILSKAKTTTKFKYSFLLRNSGKFYAFLIGIIFASSLIIMALMMPEFFGKMSTDAYTRVDYQYEAMIDVTKETPTLKTGEEKFLTLPNVEYESENISLQGLEPDNKLYKLYDKKDKEITSKLNDGVIITKSFNIFYDKNVGDTVTIKILNEDYTFEVMGITEDCGEARVYINRKKLSDIVSEGTTKDMFNGIYSSESINKDEYAVVVNKNDVLEQSESMKGFIFVAIGGILVTAIFIATIVLYILTSLTVEDNFYNISLLKVMGYSKKEVNSMILNSYLGYAVISFLISLPLTIWGVDLMMDYFSKEFHMIFPLEFAPWQGVVGLLSILLIFYIGTFSSKRKIEKVALQEVLKEYRE